MVVSIHLDDILVISPSVDVHIEELQRIFDRLRQFKLRAKRQKCSFVRRGVRYHGDMITPEGLEACPDKVPCIVNMLPPRNVAYVRTFIQTCTWYRRYIQNFTEIARPLSDLTKNSTVWEWGPAQQTSFEELHQLLTTASIL